MPTYQYLCESCGHRFDIFQHFADAPLTTCPNCSGQIHRVLFPAGIVFKGSGFYKTDSRGTSSATDIAPSAEENGHASATSSSGAEKSVSGTETATGSGSSAKAETAPASGVSADH